jgi:acyl-CoA dehydrogenase
LVHHEAWLYAQELDCVREMSMVKALCAELVNEVMLEEVAKRWDSGRNW